MRSMIGEPRVVEAGRGASWWGEGWHIFKARMGTWLLIMIVYLVIVVLISVVPYVGSIGHSLLTPVFLGGLMLGCQAVERNQDLRVGHLFEGFQGANFVPLMIIGAVNIAVWIAIALIGAAGAFGGMAMSDMGNMTDPSAAIGRYLDSFTGVGLLMFLIVLLVLLPVAMLNWFAPALVVFRGVGAIEAMKLSFLACLRNWVPFLIYSLIGLAIMVVGTVVVGLVAIAGGIGAAVGTGSSGAGIMAFIAVMLLLLAVFAVLALFVGPVVLGSVYAGYKDTLNAADAALGNPAYQ